MIVRMIKLNDHRICWFVLCVIFKWECVDDCGENKIERDYLRVAQDHARYTTYCVLFCVCRGIVCEEALQLMQDGVILAAVREIYEMENLDRF